jgi:hypothetical protein
VTTYYCKEFSVAIFPHLEQPLRDLREVFSRKEWKKDNKEEIDESELWVCNSPVRSRRKATSLLVEIKNQGTNEDSELLRHTNKQSILGNITCILWMLMSMLSLMSRNGVQTGFHKLHFLFVCLLKQCRNITSEINMYHSAFKVSQRYYVWLLMHHRMSPIWHFMKTWMCR